MADAELGLNPEVENWRLLAATAVSNIEILEAEDRVVQKNSDAAMRNALLQLAFFVALANGVAVLFTRGANLSCIWFSLIAATIACMFFLGMVLPIWYGFRQLDRYNDKLQNCVVKRINLKTNAVNLLASHDSFEGENREAANQVDVLRSVQTLKAMRDSKFIAQDQDKMYKRFFVLFLVCSMLYAGIFTFVAHKIFCNGKNTNIQVPFFSDAHVTTSTNKAEAILPRENPRSSFTGPTERWNLTASFENPSVIKHTSIHVYENGNVSVKVFALVVNGSLYQNEDGNSDQTSTSKGSAASDEHSHKPYGVPMENSAFADEPALKITCSFSSTGFSGVADVLRLMPELRHTDFYIEPRIEELAEKESSESGFCSHVKDFVVGWLGYGSIKFLGKTDVRELDIESHVQFNDHEVVVYMDETKKPPVGQCLSKPAECVDKKTGKQYIDRPKADRYKNRLIKKTAEQGAESV